MDKRLSNLGLCYRARALVSGEEIVCEYLASSKIKYIFLANDASQGSKKKIINKANYFAFNEELKMQVNEKKKY